ncbi:putative 26S proteasome regulatory subunit [Coccomyxa subellipsoidea C-169]|uniref:26S proteasome regulatory subunit n=1 Tax=Coccomyxa subellipsoidea (strain C-169) TaxID=574566 RepID=I0YMB2_COCSC|nr:putative 26S proteasome regulatory subunit [Coccomyxa subellipsoidea C-169]EIE19531.1 putative 26S proteasome regulatory subunit [Coccomyxa subellipsoidea C-169]|eukprot:XP_005644075.1 putative 26S proteasome regulatory subunit [Coccomyxa subellipsoidea C-169]
MEEFTAANIAVSDEKREEELEKTKKGTVDYSKLEEEVAAAKKHAEEGDLTAALECLLSLEKQHRLGEDITATKLCCTAILDALYEAKEWKLLNEHILLLAKRRSQLKQAVQAFVRQAMGYIDQTPDKESRVELIKTLQTVTEGKIFVEIERARLTRQLAKLKEEEGKIDEAAEILQEVAVETFGAMAKTEKIFYILEQVRLCLDRKDFIRAQILAKKVSPRAFVDQSHKKGQNAGEVGIEGTTIQAADAGTPSLPELKLMYYQLLIRYHEHNNSYIDICRCYRSIYEVPSIAEDPAKWGPVLKRICWYVILAPASSDQVTLLATTAADKKLVELPAYKELLQSFITKEVRWWSAFEKEYSGEVDAEAIIFGGEAGAKRRADLRLRVIEHNVLVIAKYYARITLARLAQLLDLSAADTEKHLSDMVVAGALTARIDRPASIVRFAARREPAVLLNGWACNIRRLLDVVENATQNIQKESMVHKVAIGAA